jgi:hypothetical protein
LPVLIAPLKHPSQQSDPNRGYLLIAFNDGDGNVILQLSDGFGKQCCFSSAYMGIVGCSLFHELGN